MYDGECSRPGCSHPAVLSEEVAMIPAVFTDDGTTEVVEAVLLCNTCTMRARYENMRAEGRRRKDPA